MRQNKFDLSKLLGKGLLSSHPAGVNQEGFVELVNLKPWESKLKYVDKLTLVPVSKKTQEFRIGNQSWAVDNSACYSISGGVLTKVLDFTETNKHWDSANFIKFGIISNGDVTIFISDGVASLDKPFDADLPASNSMTDLHGQLILGGLTSAWNNLDGTFVAWSKIGAVNFTVGKDTEAGFHNPDIGNVLKVLPLDKGFCAIGDAGVAIYKPALQTFSYKKIWGVGARDKASCAGNGEEVYFIDTFGKLCRVTGTPKVLQAEKGPEVLDYEWILRDTDASLFYSRNLDELWIRNSNGNFVLNKSGMYQRSVEVSGLFKEGSVLYGLKVSGTETAAWFKTSKLDFNIGGDKTISEVYCQDDSSGSKYTELTLTKKQVDYASREFLENDNGVTYPHLTGNVMAVKRIAKNFTSGSISNLHVQTIRVDGRSGLGWTGAQNAN